MAKEKRKDLFKEQFDGEYMGNIWGWKFSLFGLVVIVGLWAVYAYRYYVLGPNPNYDPNAPMEEAHPFLQKSDDIDKDTLR